VESNLGSPASALETWYKETITKLYRFIYAQLHNKEETEDITQETYLRCLKQASQELPSYAYLKQVARNLIIDRYRHKVRDLNRLETVPDPPSPPPEEDWLNRTIIHELLKELSPDYRQVLDLRIIQGYSRKETASFMGRSEDAVRGLQYRALQALRSNYHIYQQKGGGL